MRPSIFQVLADQNVFYRTSRMCKGMQHGHFSFHEIVRSTDGNFAICSNNAGNLDLRLHSLDHVK